jgi:hypothetical protein
MVISSSNMNAAVHTSTSVHRCRDDVPGDSAICLTTPSGGPCHDGCGQQAFPVKPMKTITTSNSKCALYYQ